MIAWITTLVFALALLAWMLIFELRLARLLDLAEGTGDQADRALGFITAHAAWIADHAAPAVERIAAIAPELADALVTHRTAVAMPLAVQPVPPAQHRPRPSPGPRTVPEQHAIRHGQRQAEHHANGGQRIDDPGLAHDLARIENTLHDFRTMLAGGGQP